jgi:hypothetical protein
VEAGNADAIAKEGSAGEGAGRVHGEDADGLVLSAEGAGKAVDQSAFAGAGGSGDADAEGLAGVGEAGGEERRGFRGVIFDEREGAGEGASVALAEAVNERREAGRRGRRGHATG